MAATNLLRREKYGYRHCLLLCVWGVYGDCVASVCMGCVWGLRGGCAGRCASSLSSSGVQDTERIPVGLR